ncbi:hypothetical protein JKF63_04366 [Porcisia hertigi]|uniref:Uncharacterized protein n=1 Tax=Porcisia hertigi TaxID=2761500 RepID=A0A836LE66_9TRYP|nr:hypothetical protein JKF63_04366 [Porcisia hertigi]
MRQNEPRKMANSVSLSVQASMQRRGRELSFERSPPVHALPCIQMVDQGEANGAASSGGVGQCRRVSKYVSETSFAGSLPDITASSLPGSSVGFLSPEEEAHRSTSEHLARRLRQVQVQETRQRTFIAEEASRDFTDLTQRHGAYLEIAITCAMLRDAQNKEEEAALRKAQRWRLQILQDTLRDTIAEEEKHRKNLLHTECSVRRSLAQLQRADAHPLLQQEEFLRLSHAEHARRCFLHRMEAEEVEAMGIPFFAPIPSSFAPGATGSQGALEQSKLDLMAQEQCPFKYAAHCPYTSQRIRLLGARWAAAVASSEDTHSAASSHRLGGCRGRPFSGTRMLRKWMRPGPGITEFGKQSIRNSMTTHYRGTTELLPGLAL